MLILKQLPLKCLLFKAGQKILKILMLYIKASTQRLITR